MKKIAIIGAGQIGSRHLQSLAKTDIEISIEIVEPDSNAAKIAKKRYEEIDKNEKVTKISFFDSINKISNELDLVIIATSSNIRYKITKQLLKTKTVKNLLLEKVLFQEIEHYYDIEKLLTETKTKCWVNHPRRMFPFYQNLKKELIDSKQISFSIYGGNWGLACNGLHFLDIFSYLSNKNSLTINTDYLLKKIYTSKRENYIEFNGKLVGTIGNHFFTLFSDENTTPTLMVINSDKLVAFIDEANGFARISTKANEWKWKIIQDKIIYYQSELTHLLIKELFSKNNCNLPTYHEAMQLHISFIQSLLDFMESIEGKKSKNCPIT